MEKGRRFWERISEIWHVHKVWLIVPLAATAIAVTLVMVFVPPSSESDSSVDRMETAEDEEQAVEENADQDEPNQEPDGGAPDRDISQEIEITQGEEGGPAVVIKFPDPEEAPDREPPEGGYGDIYGQWVLEMEGASYGLENCHIQLVEDGSIKVSDLYSELFEVMEGSYAWERGGTAFSGDIKLAVKIVSGQAAVPVEVKLSGQVLEGLERIEGEFTATPQGEAYAPYAQQGPFTMHR